MAQDIYIVVLVVVTFKEVLSIQEHNIIMIIFLEHQIALVESTFYNIYHLFI